MTGTCRANRLPFSPGDTLPIEKCRSNWQQELDGSGAPRQITPRKGDQFTILEQWYTLDDAGEWVISEQPGETLTFSGKPFTALAYEGYPGEYSLGIIVEDLLGNTTAEYTTVQVVEE